MGIKIRRRASAQWTGPVPTGIGQISLGSGAMQAPYSLKSRTEDGTPAGTNPEELIGAGLAGCFAMSFGDLLEGAGITNAGVHAKAMVQLEQTETGFSITRIDLTVSGHGDGLDPTLFKELATKAKDTCPVSRALAGTEISLTVESE
ncbi:MAG: OsmC family peroxiredoxin [Nakamurella sp.]